MTAGVETDVLGIGRDDLLGEALAAVTAAHPRPDFKRRILNAFNDGMRSVHTPHSAPSTPTCWLTSTTPTPATTS